MSVYFGGLRAVEDVTLAARGGMIIGLVGPNGAGTTTTFYACSGPVRPTKGEVSFGGVEITR